MPNKEWFEKKKDTEDGCEEVGAGSPLHKLLDEMMREISGVDASENNDSKLLLKRQEFIAKMLEEENGQQLLDLLERGEWRVCERLGMSNAFIGDDNEPYIKVPNWDRLVAHLQIVNSV